MDKNTKISFGIAIILAIIDFLVIFIFPPVTLATKIILFVVNLIMAFNLAYYNHPTSVENCEATGEIRMKKQIKKAMKKGAMIIGETFDDLADEIKDDEEVG